MPVSFTTTYKLFCIFPWSWIKNNIAVLCRDVFVPKPFNSLPMFQPWLYYVVIFCLSSVLQSVISCLDAKWIPVKQYALCGECQKKKSVVNLTAAFQDRSQSVCLVHEFSKQAHFCFCLLFLQWPASTKQMNKSHRQQKMQQQKHNSERQLELKMERVDVYWTSPTRWFTQHAWQGKRIRLLPVYYLVSLVKTM